MLNPPTRIGEWLEVELITGGGFTSCFSYIYSARGRIEGQGDSISQSTSANPSDAVLDSLPGDRGRALFADPNATGHRRMHYLGAGANGTRYRRWNSSSLSDLHHADCNRLYSHSD